MIVALIFDLVIWLLGVFMGDAWGDCLGSQAIKVNVRAEKAPIRQVLGAIARPGECSLALDAKVQGDISLQLEQLPWFEAISIAALQEHLSVTRLQHVLLVGAEKNTPRKTPMTRRQVPLNHVSADVMAGILKTQAKGWLSKEGRLLPEPRENAMIVHEHIDRVQLIVDLIHSLDTKKQHVRLAAKLLFVEDELMSALGVNWGESKGWHIALPGISKQGMGLLHFRPESLLLFEHSGRVSVVAKPLLMTTSGVEASIESGEQMPYQERSAQGNISVRFKKAVLRLTITPEVLTDHRLHLSLSLNQDQVSPRMIQGVPAIQTQHLHICEQNWN